MEMFRLTDKMSHHVDWLLVVINAFISCIQRWPLIEYVILARDEASLSTIKSINATAVEI